VLPLFPALKRRAIVKRPSGAGCCIRSTAGRSGEPLLKSILDGLRPVALSLLRYDFVLQVLSGMCQILRTAEITPIIFVGAEGEDFLSLGGEA
jgi:hypothetical protein